MAASRLINAVCHNYLATTAGPAFDNQLFEITVGDFMRNFYEEDGTWKFKVAKVEWCAEQIRSAQMALRRSNFESNREKVQDILSALATVDKDTIVYLATASPSYAKPGYNEHPKVVLKDLPGDDLLRQDVNAWDSYTRFGVHGKSRGVCNAAMTSIKSGRMCVWAEDQDDGNSIKLNVAGGAHLSRKIDARDEDFRVGSAQLIVTNKRSALGDLTATLDSVPPVARSQTFTHDMLILAAYSETKELYAVVWDPTYAQFSPEKLDEVPEDYGRQLKLLKASKMTSMPLPERILCAVPLAIKLPELNPATMKGMYDITDTFLADVINQLNKRTVEAAAEDRRAAFGQLHNYSVVEKFRALSGPLLTDKKSGVIREITNVKGNASNKKKLVTFKDHTGGEHTKEFQALKFVDNCSRGVVWEDEKEGTKRLQQRRPDVKPVKRDSVEVGGVTYQTRKPYVVQLGQLKGREIKIVSFSPTKTIEKWMMKDTRGDYRDQGRRPPPDLAEIIPVQTAPKHQKSVGLGLPKAKAISTKVAAETFLEGYPELEGKTTKEMQDLLKEEGVPFKKTDELWMLKIKYVDATKQ